MNFILNIKRLFHTVNNTNEDVALIKTENKDSESYRIVLQNSSVESLYHLLKKHYESMETEDPDFWEIDFICK